MQTALLIAPELVTAMAAGFFFCSTLVKVRHGVLQVAALAAGGAAFCFSALTVAKSGLIFHAVYTIDPLSQAFKLIVYAGVVLILWIGAGLRGITRSFSAEYYLFLTLCCLGLSIMVSAAELITMIIGIEIASYALYVLLPLRSGRSERQPLEAGIKYVFFGGAATAVSLYGMSYLFGIVRSTYLVDILQVLPDLLVTQPLAVIGLAMLVASICYKLALAPMHYWMPDVFVGAAHETSCLIATLPKAAAVCLLLRFLSIAGTDAHTVVQIFGAMAMVSMFIGNLSALGQQDVKRLLAYSGIAHAGYLLVGILALNRIGISAVIYYTAGYVVMTAACFFVLYRIAPQGENITVDDLRNLHRRSPLLAATLAVGAMGLAGIPPTVGFTGKLFMFAGALQRGNYLLAVSGILNICIGAFYYLRLVRAAYAMENGRADPVELPLHARVCAMVLVAAILGAGIFPGIFFDAVLPAVLTLIRFS